MLAAGLKLSVAPDLKKIADFFSDLQLVTCL